MPYHRTFFCVFYNAYSLCYLRRAWNERGLCREFDHLVPLAHLDNGEDYLVEVGWGSSNVSATYCNLSTIISE